jgi:hypothetical protein
MPRTPIEITTSDVPQAPNLPRIRCVITAIAFGMTTNDDIAEETDISARHVAYAIRAAQTLGLLDGARALTELGRTLVASAQESDEERALFRSAIEKSPVLRAIAPSLLGPKPPSKKALGARIERLSGLSKGTAEHRASDLLSWREQLVDSDAAMPAETATAAAPFEATPSEEMKPEAE